MTSSTIYTATDRTPYTYLIGWTDYNKWYYGVRYGIHCNPSDLWKSYFTSSNKVKQFITTHGEPDIVTVRKIFDDPKKAKLWEDRVLMHIPKDKRDCWLNARFGSFPGVVITDDIRKNMARKKIGYIPLEHFKDRDVVFEKMRNTKIKNDSFKRSEACKAKIKFAMNEGKWLVGTKWYHDGINKFRLHPSDPKTKTLTKGKLDGNCVYYTNGKITKRIHDKNDIPDGFYPGRHWKCS